MKWTFKRVMAQTFLTHIGRMGVGALLLLIGGLMGPMGIIGQHIFNFTTNTTVWDIMMYIGGALLAIEVLLFVVFAWIINPIKSLLKKK